MDCGGGTAPKLVAVATQMKATFRSVRFGLMVGIGGGVPSTDSDIRLGDVVVSQPHQGYGGVVQYDFVKATPSRFQRTEFPAADTAQCGRKNTSEPPPTTLQTLGTRLQALPSSRVHTRRRRT